VALNENSLLRSGLALAGANKLRSAASEDGVLTALEAAGLDLWGTKLVVLSACETGLGEVKNRYGVYGLRRAIVLAGAESELMSLWQVSDAATRDLMIGYYKRLMARESRVEAFRHVQLEMLKSKSENRPVRKRTLKVDWAKSEDRRHPLLGELYPSGKLAKLLMIHLRRYVSPLSLVLSLLSSASSSCLHSPWQHYPGEHIVALAIAGRLL